MWVPLVVPPTGWAWWGTPESVSFERPLDPGAPSARVLGLLLYGQAEIVFLPQKPVNWYVSRKSFTFFTRFFFSVASNLFSNHASNPLRRKGPVAVFPVRPAIWTEPERPWRRVVAGCPGCKELPSPRLHSFSTSVFLHIREKQFLHSVPVPPPSPL